MLSIHFEGKKSKPHKTHFSFSSIRFYLMVTYLPKLSSVQVQPIRQVDDVGLKT